MVTNLIVVLELIIAVVLMNLVRIISERRKQSKLFRLRTERRLQHANDHYKKRGDSPLRK
jgi:hypothetical protein